ncbi:MAG: type I methionyl aminopeptidase [Candidatus Gastranaerophilales bacterium]|nr:type I methionyl aminopeptidase [Candidatus Gastranaerophilales bacterium]
MSVHKKSREEIKLMKIAGSVVAMVHQEMKKVVKPGVSTKYLDDIAMQVIKDNKCEPTFLGYNGFEGCICASINDKVVHGIPSKDTIIKDGDIIAIDVGATFRGLVGDSAWSYAVGEIDDDKKRLMKATEESLFAGLSVVKDGVTLDVVGGAIEDVANKYNLGIVRQYGGHGVGHSMHEEPFIYNYRVGNKFVIKSGMTLAIEPMLNLGCDDVHQLDDGWSVMTNDGKASAHFEHSILVIDDGCEILTKLQ